MPPSLATLEKGHRIPPSTFELSLGWVREYVAAVEDAAIAALDPELVPPMAVAALAVRALLEGTELPPGAIHIGQEIALRRPVRAGQRLQVRADIASRGERQGWVLMGIELTVEGEDRAPVMTGRATLTMPSGEEV